MSLFKRISDNFRANLNSLLDKAEDPVKLLEQYLRDMEDDIADAEGAVAKQLAVVKKFQMQHEEAAAMAAKRESQALEALAQEREDLARKALEDKRIHNAKAADYQQNYQTSQSTAERLKQQLREMKTEYEQLQAKKDSLVARVQAAKAQKNLQGMTSGFGSTEARRGFDRMEAQVRQLEAEAEVAAEMKGAAGNLDEELLALKDNQIDEELARLKAKLKS